MKKQISMMMKGILFSLLWAFSLRVSASMESYSGNIFGQIAPEAKDMFYTYGIDNINDSIARKFRALGVTSIESYVTWETCERAGEGKWNWTEWDRTVKVLEDNGLKRVPFLILGPAYSPPDWSRMSSEHYPYPCLEHGFDNQVESLWNPIA